MWSELSPGREVMVWLGLGSVVAFLASIVALPVVIVRMRDDYFLPRDSRPGGWRPRSALGWLRLVLKNLLGGTLVLAGLAMLVLPGQGVLTILFGIALLSFPGKRALELWLVRINGVKRMIDAVRARYGRPPLRIPPRRPLGTP
jgi:hypothetical protein